MVLKKGIPMEADLAPKLTHVLKRIGAGRNDLRKKRWAFLTAVVLGTITLILSVVHISYMLFATPHG